MDGQSGLMQIIAGVLFAWSAVCLLLAVFTGLVWIHIVRKTFYLSFAVSCCFLSLFYSAHGAHYLADNLQESVWPVRVILASMIMAAATLLSLVLNRSMIEERMRHILHLAIHCVAVFLSGLSVAGLITDNSQPLNKELHFGFGTEILYAHEFTFWGYLVDAVAVIYAIITVLLLAKSVKKDRLARTFFQASCIIMCLLTLNDILLLANIIRSVHLVAHGVLFLLLSFLVGFFREHELSQEKLREKTHALELADERLERVADETRKLRPIIDLGKFSASLAHEIRNPLAVLSNVASLLQQKNGKTTNREEFNDHIRMLQEEITRIGQLVEELLLFSRTGRVTKEPIDAFSVVELSVTDVNNRHTISPNVQIVTEVEKDLPPILGSMADLRRALVNLINNAIQSSSTRCSVKVIARLSHGPRETVMIGVEDMAGGVPVKFLKTIFEPFFSTRSTGTGLGLPIVKSIVEAHGGVLVLENRPGQGAVFWIHLPMA